MITEHPSELELQQYAMDMAGCPPAVRPHIDTCQSCREAIVFYQRILMELKQQPAPAFDFDVSALVLPQLPVAPAGVLTERVYGYWFAIIAAGAVGIPAYLFRKNLSLLFAGTSFYFMYAIVGAALAVVVVRLMVMYRKYQQQIESLNIY